MNLEPTDLQWCCSDCRTACNWTSSESRWRSSTCRMLTFYCPSGGACPQLRTAA
jgi:hypothetical protein